MAARNRVPPNSVEAELLTRTPVSAIMSELDTEIQKAMSKKKSLKDLYVSAKITDDSKSAKSGILKSSRQSDEPLQKKPMVISSSISIDTRSTKITQAGGGIGTGTPTLLAPIAPVVTRETESRKTATRTRAILKRFEDPEYRADLTFVESAPQMRKSYDIFGDCSDDILLSRRLLRTPPEIRRKLQRRRERKQSQLTALAEEEARRKSNVDILMLAFGGGAGAGTGTGMKTPEDAKRTPASTMKSHTDSMRTPKIETARKEKEKESSHEKEKKEGKSTKSAGSKGKKQHKIESEDGLTKKPSMSFELSTMDPFEGQKHKYFGVGAKLEFNAMFRDATKNLYHYPDDDELPSEMQTPRKMYLRELTKNDLLPLPLLVRKDGAPYDVSLAHRGLGDERAAPIIDVIDKLPAISTINLCDNRLTDETLMPLALKLTSFKNLTYLDLSYNKMDDSSESILEFLQMEDCSLTTLLLNGADVDDGECGNLMEAFAANKSVHTLGLAHNLIGKNEILNTVQPDLTTGGEAIADMLKVNKTLTKLDLAWNAIRLESAVSLGEAFEENNTLKTLNLAYNAFGNLGTQVLGRALRKNTALEEIDLTSNSMTPKSATVLANSLSYNKNLRKLVLDGNVLGLSGAQALVAMMQKSSAGNAHKLYISFKNCDCTKVDPTLFNPAAPNGRYTVDVEEPYGQMVVEECIFLASHTSGCGINYLSHQGHQVELGRAAARTAKKFDPRKFKKVARQVANDILKNRIESATSSLEELLSMFSFNVEEELRVEVLQKMKERADEKTPEEREELHDVILFEIFCALFIVSDDDGSGDVDVGEFMNCLERMGRGDITEEHAKLLMSNCDIDGSGTINADEFSMIMVNEFCKTDVPKGIIVEKYSKRPWKIPKEGTVVIDVTYEAEVPSRFNIGHDEGLAEVLDAMRKAKTDDQRETIFKQATNSPYFYFTANQAQTFLETSMKDFNFLKLDSVAVILPQIVNAEEVIKFLDRNLSDEEKYALRIRLGSLFNIYCGMYTGHYCLDLRNEIHTKGGRTLAAIATAEMKMCKQMGLDMSQRGKIWGYRNEHLGQLLIEITGAWFLNCPSSGIIHFDYMSISRPLAGTKALSENRFHRLLSNIGLSEIPDEYERLTNTSFIKDREKKKEIEEMKRIAAKMESMSTRSNPGTASLTARRSVTPASDAGSRPTTSAADPEPRKSSVATPLPTVSEISVPLPAPSSSLRSTQKSLDESQVISIDTSAAMDALNEGTAIASSASSLKSSASNSVRTAGSQVGIDAGDSKPSGQSGGVRAKQALKSAVKGMLLGSTLMKKAKSAKWVKPEPRPIEKPLTALLCKEFHTEYIESSHHYFDILPEEQQRDFRSKVMRKKKVKTNPQQIPGLDQASSTSVPSTAESGGAKSSENGEERDTGSAPKKEDPADPDARPETPERLKRAPPPSRTHHDIWPFCFRRILMLQVVAPTIYLNCKQLGEILLLFPEDVDFMRVMVLQSLFNRIVDLENIYRVFDEIFTRNERDEALHRMGILAIYDPMNVDREFRLDLRRWEHREWCKILIQLAIAEPGENWVDATYSWSRYDSPVPGWELPEPWTKPDDEADAGPRKYGWLIVTYRSVGFGCQALVGVRKNLRKRVLIGLKRSL